MPPIDSSDRDIVRPLSIFIAAGPFSTDENVLYEPLDDLLKVVSKENPDVLLLIGPFVDSTNSLIETDKLDESYDDIFEHVVEKLKDISEKTSVVLIPSLRDIHHDFVFPQPAFDQVKNKKVICKN
jgi:DNA polymerase alpha subunit B